MRYEIEFRNHNGLAVFDGKLEAETDGQAMEQARTLFRCDPGDCYEIRHDGRCVHIHVERSDGNTAAPGYWARVHACIEQALASGDLQKRRLLMILAEKFLECAPESPDGEGETYTAFLIDESEEPVAELQLGAENDAEAFALASTIAEVGVNAHGRFELWRGSELKSAVEGPFLRLSPTSLREYCRRQVVAWEIALHESRKTIAESRELLQNVDRWLRSGVYEQQAHAHSG